MSIKALEGKKVIVIGGPTASGKSALALKIAQQFGGYIINADAMQLYRDLPVLSAQPDAADLRLSAHHLYGFLPLDQACSAVNWAARAQEIIAANQGLPVLAGGTGLYLRSLLQGLSPIPDIPEKVQQQGKALLADLRAPGMHRLLQKIDPSMAARLHPNDSHRLLRAWNVMKATGRSLAEWQKEPPAPSPFVPLYFLLLPPRNLLYQTCDQRFIQMIEKGALAEVEGALARYAYGDRTLPGFKTLGFRELAAFLEGKCSLSEAIAAAQQYTRNYAKRQITWFTHQIRFGNKISTINDKMKLPEKTEAEIFAKIKDFLLTGHIQAG